MIFVGNKPIIGYSIWRMILPSTRLAWHSRNVGQATIQPGNAVVGHLSPKCTDLNQRSAIKGIWGMHCGKSSFMRIRERKIFDEYLLDLGVKETTGRCIPDSLTSLLAPVGAVVIPLSISETPDRTLHHSPQSQLQSLDVQLEAME